MSLTKLTCIECPVGCALSVDVENCRVVKVTGNKCPRGEQYAVAEVERPERILTSSVLCSGLNLKMLPVRTDRAIPKSRLMDGMARVRELRVNRGVSVGEVIEADFLGLGVNLVATRSAKAPLAASGRGEESAG